MAARNKGQFRKGQSGNPGGRRKSVGEVKDLAASYTVEAIERLAFWMRSNEPKASVAAANALLDRAWGKPTQPLEGGDGKPLVQPVIHLTVGDERKTLSSGGAPA